MFSNDNDDDGHCFVCGGIAPWIVLIAGEDEPPHEEWSCEVHARGHWRWALVTPPAEADKTQESQEYVGYAW